MKSNVVPTLLATSVLAVLLCGAIWLLLAQPWICSIRTDIDINSGALRRQVYVCSFRVRDEIQESRFSREVRRLGIGLTGTPLWKGAQERALLPGIDTHCTYGYALLTCDELVELLAESNLPEQDRRMILERFLTILGTGTPRDFPELLGRLTWYIKRAQFPNEFRRAGRDANLAEILRQESHETGDNNLWGGSR